MIQENKGKLEVEKNIKLGDTSNDNFDAIVLTNGHVNVNFHDCERIEITEQTIKTSHRKTREIKNISFYTDGKRCQISLFMKGEN
jgi:hypothetical protein